MNTLSFFEGKTKKRKRIAYFGKHATRSSLTLSFIRSILNTALERKFSFLLLKTYSELKSKKQMCFYISASFNSNHA